MSAGKNTYVIKQNNERLCIMTEYLRDARWIWQKDALSANAHAEFFTRFFSSSGKQYYFYVSADSNYALYINDRFIESGQYPDFHSYKVYDRINITPYVASGDNNVHIIGYCQNQPSSTYRPGKAGIIFSITEEEGGVYLEMELDESLGGICADMVTTESLGLPRITECPFDAPDGSSVKISHDIFGAKRGKNPTTGAIEGIKAGKVKVKIW